MFALVCCTAIYPCLFISKKTVDDVHALAMVPPGVDLTKALNVFVPEIQSLQNGWLLSEQEQLGLPGKYRDIEQYRIFVTGGVGVGQADMVDAAVFSAHLGVGANKCDRSSQATKADISQASEYSVGGENRKTLQQLRELRKRGDKQV